MNAKTSRLSNLRSWMRALPRQTTFFQATALCLACAALVSYSHPGHGHAMSSPGGRDSPGKLTPELRSAEVESEAWYGMEQRLRDGDWG
ncbi:uncharacterized protein LY89DRAFT_392873 [Mollisia scopiformis]|uniref:PH domain-containing protein n=1 Tax=Mollisia scopiformis TaxID=149040 RepID=A0A194XPS7_MOLSC|nr:uncharacterized protein LY89DRAFT_392873 [Mollisia scopiformis]KUJ22059.1 hypothetical protein LY89DRAFT_392873 [Mollisia scopiformis]